MPQNNLVIGGIALLAGVLLGLLFAPRGANVDEIQSALEDRLAAFENEVGEGMSSLQGRMDETVSSIETQFTDLGERVGAVETSVGENAEAQSSMVESLRAEMSRGMDSLGSTISAQTENIQSRIANFGETLSGQAAAPPEPASSEPAEDQAAADGGDAAEEVQVDDNFVGIGVGQTAIFGDGALRAFVSMVDADAQIARLSVNGTNTEMEAGQSIGVNTAAGTYCRLMLSGLQGSEVALNAACGDDLPAPVGVRPGNIMMLADGSIRVFVSSVADDGSAARVAINGVDTQSVEIGSTVTVPAGEQNCDVTLDDIDRGHVALSASCG